MTSITIPSSLKSIPTYLFGNCENLSSVTISNGVTSIGSYAFYGCTSITSITIPSSITSIAYDAFNNCPKLNSFSVNSSNQTYKSVNGVIYSKDGSIIVMYPRGKSGSYTIVSGTTTIGESAFEYTENLTSVTIPSSVTSIGTYAFYSSLKLESVIIGSGVRTIDDRAFYYCPLLESVTMGSNVTSIGNSAFEDCTSLTSVTIPSRVTSIGSSAFRYCDILTYVDFENNITSDSNMIGSNAFRNNGSNVEYHFKDYKSYYYALNYHSSKFTSTNNFTYDGPIQYIITFAVNNPTYGSINYSGSNWYNSGVSLTLQATAYPDYRFVGWSTNGGYSITSTSNPYTITVSRQITYTAVFDENSLNIITNTDGHGTISATASTVQYGGSVTVTAAPSSSSYEFNYFTVNGGSPIYENPYTVTNITQDTTITAYFKLKTYSVTTSTDGNGSITASATVTHGGSFQVTATPNASYLFDYFILNNDTSNPITTNPYTITNITQNTTIVAYFKRAYAHTSATSGGEVRVSGNNLGAEHTSESVTYTAIPYTNYYLIGWFIDGVLYTQNGNTVLDKTITLTQAQAQGAWVVPVFSTNPSDTPTLNTTLENTTAVNSTIGGEARMVGIDNTDTQATLIAKASENYRFIGWYDGETLLGTDLSIRLNLSTIQNKIIIARFEPINSNNNDQTDSGNIDIL